MELTDDLVRASQAQVSAERMVSMGRSYVLTREPDLLARALGAEAKLQKTLGRLELRATVLDEAPLFEPIRTSAQRYSEALQEFLADTAAGGAGALVAETLRQRVMPARDGFIVDLDEFISHRRRQIAASQMATRDHTGRAVPLLGGVCLLAVLASILLARVALDRDSAVVALAFRHSELPFEGWPAEGKRRGHSDPAIDPTSPPATPTSATILQFSRATDDGAPE
jgi:CHASE3 domain sensor protein